MADQLRDLRPLDLDFVEALARLLVAPDASVNTETRAWWEDFFTSIQDQPAADLAAIISNRYVTERMPPEALEDPLIEDLIDRGWWDLSRSTDGPARPLAPPQSERDPSPPDQGRPESPARTPPETPETPETPHTPETPAGRASASGGLSTPSTPGPGSGASAERSGRGSGQEAANPNETPSGTRGGTRTSPRTPLTTPSTTPGGTRPTTAGRRAVPSKPDAGGDSRPGGAATSTPAKDQAAQPHGSTAPPPRPDLPDMSASHRWRGQSQPPVGVRAQQILNWARDEDVDRRRDFRREWREAWAWVGDQLSKGELGDNTRRVLLDAKGALQVHETFEDYHYRRFASLKVFDPATLPRYEARLHYREEHPIQLGTWGPGSRAPTARDQPGRGQNRPWTEVNNMWRTEGERELGLDPSLDAQQPAHLEALAKAEDALWRRQPDDGDPGADNLAVRESNSYRGCVGVDDVGLEGWTHLERSADGASWVRRLWDGSALQNTGGCFAAERGARRAGLQAALRQFSSAENRAAAAAGRGMLVLPPEEADVPDPEDVRREAGIGDGRPIEILSLPANQMQTTQGKMDPQGYTANMAQFWRGVRDRMEEARELYMASDGPARGPTAELDNGDQVSYNPGAPLPPNSIFGPYVWRGVSPDTEFNQDMLRQMRGLRRLFDRERSIAPRQLMTEMDRWYRSGYTKGPRPKGLDDPRHSHPTSSTVRGLDQIEMEWIRFLLNQSMTPGMADDLQPRTTLFIKFAERLNRIFTDPGDALFQTRDASVTIEELISHMAKMKGPVEKVVFYPYDVKLWLERLHVQGRCRYTEDWREHGRVQRPLLNHFPEHLILWRDRADAEVDFDAYPEDMIYSPRFDDLRTWHDVVHTEPQALDEKVAHYFHCLAYRWGTAACALERRERRPADGGEATWLTQPPLAFGRMQEALSRFERHFRDATGWDANDEGARARPMGAVENSPLVEVMQRTLGRPWGAPGAERVRTDAALRAIRDGIIDECARNDSMLFRGRSADYADPDAPRTRESVWGWAGPAARGEARRFFGLDRWPPQLQGEDARRRAAADADADPQQAWDAYLEDPTPWTYHRPKARPYSDSGVKFNAGHRVFPIGDTARQKEVVKNKIVKLVRSSAAGDDDGHTRRRPGLFRRLTSVLGLKRRRPVDEDEDVLPAPKLPRVDPRLVAPSYDPLAEAEAAARAYDDDDDDDDDAAARAGG